MIARISGEYEAKKREFIGFFGIGCVVQNLKVVWDLGTWRFSICLSWISKDGDLFIIKILCSLTISKQNASHTEFSRQTWALLLLMFGVVSVKLSQ